MLQHQYRKIDSTTLLGKSPLIILGIMTIALKVKP